MTARQSLLKKIYPLLMKAGKWFGMKAGIEQIKGDVKPLTPFYNLRVTANNGTEISFTNFEGKNVLVVNTASDCGYTAQLEELETLNELYKDKLIIIGFPANDFKEQERRTDEEIAVFCYGTFGIQFLLVKKSQVIKGEKQHPVFQWLTDRNKNGWNNKAPEWNFSKYLVNKQGVLTHYFGPAISPLSDAVKKNLE